MKDKFLGFYDYTVVLTYISFGIAIYGIYEAVAGHKVITVVCLLLCGLCDGFDGRIARTKKNRTDGEKRFGIQIDSLCDLVCFGILPCFLGYAEGLQSRWFLFCYIPFALSALIRLAYFNVLEEERQNKEEGKRKHYLGVPVTSTAVVFPFVCVLKYLNEPLFISAMIFVYLAYSVLFIIRIKVGKPGLRGSLIMIGIGALEFVLFMIVRHLIG